jgi:hypothetical protein
VPANESAWAARYERLAPQTRRKLSREGFEPNGFESKGFDVDCGTP